VSLWIAVSVLRRRPVPGATEFAIAMVAVGCWSATSALEWGAPSLQVVMSWMRLQFVAIAAIPVLWFTFASKFSGHHDWIAGRRAWTLWVIPIITVLLVWTYEYHGLMLGPHVYDPTIPYSGIRIPMAPGSGCTASTRTGSWGTVRCC